MLRGEGDLNDREVLTHTGGSEQDGGGNQEERGGMIWWIDNGCDQKRGEGWVREWV